MPIPKTITSMPQTYTVVFVRRWVYRVHLGQEERDCWICHKRIVDGDHVAVVGTDRPENVLVHEEHLVVHPLDYYILEEKQ